jgi:hypothetical protein
MYKLIICNDNFEKWLFEFAPPEMKCAPYLINEEYYNLAKNMLPPDPSVLSEDESKKFATVIKNSL